MSAVIASSPSPEYSIQRVESGNSALLERLEAFGATNMFIITEADSVKLRTYYLNETSEQDKMVNSIVDKYLHSEEEIRHYPINKIRLEYEKFYLAKLGMKVYQIAEEFSQLELNILGFMPKEVFPVSRQLLILRKHFVKLYPRTLSCFSYALLHAGELAAQESVFFFHNRSFNFLASLKTWGYQCVKTPQKGDLVIYHQEGEPLHMGYYHDQEEVISKFGCGNDYYCHHHLHMVFSLYGKQISFYRKAAAGVYRGFSADITALSSTRFRVKMLYSKRSG